MTPNKLRQGDRGGALKVILLVLGGILLLLIVAGVAAVWGLKRYARVDVERTAGGKRVQISTPFGELRVDKADAIAAEMKLPIYPGAVPKEQSASVKLRGRAGEEEGGLDITVAEFLTPDSLEKVDAYYRQQLGPAYKREVGEVTKTVRTQREERWRKRISVEARGVSYTKETEGRVRGVALEPWGSEVKITLFEVWEAQQQ